MKKYDFIYLVLFSLWMPGCANKIQVTKTKNTLLFSQKNLIAWCIVPYDSTKYEQHVVRYGETLPDSTQKRIADKNIYELQFSNKGGMVMPIIIEWTYKDGSHEIERIPAQVWRLNENTVKKVFVKDKEVASIRLDPMRETADIDENNNAWPKTIEPSRFQLFKERQRELRAISNENNPMQKAAEKEKKAF